MTTPIDGRVSLESAFRATVRLNGAPIGEADAMSGGAATASLPRTVLGSNLDMVGTVGSRRDHGDLNLTFKFARITALELQRTLLSQVSSGSIDADLFAINGDGSTYGTPMTYSGGTIQSVTPVSYDNESSTVAKVMVIVSGGRYQ